MFCSLDQALTDGGYPGLMALLGPATAALSLVCDVKDSCGDKFFRLNDQRVGRREGLYFVHIQ